MRDSACVCKSEREREIESVFEREFVCLRE